MPHPTCVFGPVAVASLSAGAMSLGLQGVSVNCLTIAAVLFQFNKGIMCSYKVSLLLSAMCFWCVELTHPAPPLGSCHACGCWAQMQGCRKRSGLGQQSTALQSLQIG